VSAINHTARLEAFSDGVFSIAITLLVFNLQVPRDLSDGRSLFTALLELWPLYFSFIVSFATIGVMWMNHHNLFKLINRTDHVLLVLNILLLMMVTFVNFPTALLGIYIQDADNQRIAALIYSGTFFITAIIFNLLWRYASHNNRLLDPSTDPQIVRGITAQYRFGPLLYLLAFVLAFFSMPASLVVNALLALFFALPSRRSFFGGD
jgi:uncharacterized membrane protein